MPTDPATDSNTAIILKDATPPIAGMKDTFTLDGNTNSLTDATATTAASITFKVLGNGGSNTVAVSNASKSTITDDIGVDASATAPAGHNTIDIVNVGGTNTVAVGGPKNAVSLNGDATNTVTAGPGAAVQIGSFDDDHFGFKSTVTFFGAGNTLSGLGGVGGDEDFTVKGAGATGTTVHIGDGNNVITLGGTGNIVSVWGGNNNINAGGSGAKVTILGLDGNNTATPTDPDGPDDASVPLDPTDNVTIAGTGDSVTATYENVNTSGFGVTGATNVKLGDGNNSVVLGDNALGNLASGSIVTVGNGANVINVTGGKDTINLGDGANGVTLSGEGEIVNVTDPTGVGQDIVKLGSGAGAIGDQVNLDHAGGKVTGTGLGTTTVNQAGPNAVTVDLGNGIGAITLGDGNDTVTANGNGTHVKAGNGNDTVTANGATDVITLGNGNKGHRQRQCRPCHGRQRQQHCHREREHRRIQLRQRQQQADRRREQ